MGGTRLRFALVNDPFLSVCLAHPLRERVYGRTSKDKNTVKPAGFQVFLPAHSAWWVHFMGVEVWIGWLFTAAPKSRLGDDLPG